MIPLDTQLRVFTDRIDQSPCDGCDHCGTRCTSGIQVLRSEYEAALVEMRRLPAGEVERVLGQQKQLPIPGTDEIYPACEFRDTEHGRCLIYPARPTICRLFGHVEWLPCPIFKVEKVQPGAVPLMQSYATEPRKTFADWAAADDLPWPPIPLAEPLLECGSKLPLSSPAAPAKGPEGCQASPVDADGAASTTDREKSGSKLPHSKETRHVHPSSSE
jgi:Fe-S-cluster containining protein